MPPIRIQRSRKKGFRLPPNTVCVSRPSPWRNPFKIGDYVDYNAADAVADFRLWMARDFSVIAFERAHGKPPTINEVRASLRGKNLACWCALGEPCHADVLLDLANAAPTQNPRAANRAG